MLETDFVPENLNCRDWANVKPYVDRLLAAPLDTPEALEQWLLRRSDVESVVSDAGSRLNVDMTCHTDDETKQQAYREFQQKVMPEVRRASFLLDRYFYASPARTKLPQHRYFVLDRDTKADIDIFREENVPIQTEISGLQQEHSKVTGGQTVEFEGRTQTLPQMTKYQENADRSVRESAWRAVARCTGQDRERLREIFDAMLEKRHQIGINAGFENYRDYVFRQKKRFDYTVRDCEAYHDAVAEMVVPVYRRLGEERASAMQVDAYRPWDQSVDALGRPPLDPFEGDIERMVEGGQRIFDLVDEQLGELYGTMRDGQSLDLDTRYGKRPGGYQTTFAISRRPFIFMNSAGLGRDFRTLLHESGHAFHTMLGGNDPLMHYRHAPIEFCEVASMSMELTAMPWLSKVYATEEEANRARRVQLENVIRLLPWIAQIDAFQQWIYTYPRHSHEEREAKWLELDERFGPGVAWSGIEEYRTESWQKQLHLFAYPFYYIEYGIAQLGALQVWVNYRRNPMKAIADYKDALSLGGSMPLPTLFERAGAKFDFGAETIGRVMKDLEGELGKLPI